MRIRSNFVSNSSSASFIVMVEKNKQDLCTLFLNKIPKFSLFDFKNSLGDTKLYLQQRLEKAKEEYKDNPEEKKLFWGTPSYFEEKLKKIEEDFENILPLEERFSEDWTEEEKFNFCNHVLDYYGISFQKIFDDTENLWKFGYWATMFNDYGDIPELLREIIITLNFDNSKIRCEVLED